MPQRSNWFQRLVATLEEQLAPTGFKVQESKMIRDRSSNTDREVDVVIEGRVGIHHTILGIECRDHKKAADQTWIDEIASKHENLRIHRAVLVSRSGFTKGAIEKCEALGLATITFVDDEVPNWAQVVPRIASGVVCSRYVTVGTRSLFFRPSEHEGTTTFDDKSRFSDRSGKELVSLGELSQRAACAQEIGDRVVRELLWSSHVVARICVLTDVGTTLKNANGDEREVHSLIFEMTCEQESKEFEFKKGTYGSVALAYEEVFMDVGKVRLMLYETEDGNAVATMKRPRTVQRDGKCFAATGKGSFFLSRKPDTEQLTLTPRTVEVLERAEKEFVRRFKIYKSELKETIINPDSAELLAISDLASFLRTDHIGGPEADLWLAKRVDKTYGLVAACSIAAERVRIHEVYKVPIEMYGEDSNPSPLQLLQRLAQRFGVIVSAGDISSKFIFAARVPHSGETTQFFSIGSKGKAGHIHLSTTIFSRTVDHMEVAVAFVIDTDALRAALGLRTRFREPKDSRFKRGKRRRR